MPAEPTIIGYADETTSVGISTDVACGRCLIHVPAPRGLNHRLWPLAALPAAMYLPGLVIRAFLLGSGASERLLVLAFALSTCALMALPLVVVQWIVRCRLEIELDHRSLRVTRRGLCWWVTRRWGTDHIMRIKLGVTQEDLWMRQTHFEEDVCIRLGHSRLANQHVADTLKRTLYEIRNPGQTSPD